MAEFQDILVLYPSVNDVEEGLWVAHSIRTDQVGVGHDPIEAVRELMLGVRTLLDEAKNDPQVRVEQSAPNEVLQLFRNAEQIPDPLWKRVQEAIQTTLHPHDADETYWSDSDGDPEEGWNDRPFFREIHNADLCGV